MRPQLSSRRGGPSPGMADKRECTPKKNNSILTESNKRRRGTAGAVEQPKD